MSEIPLKFEKSRTLNVEVIDPSICLVWINGINSRTCFSDHHILITSPNDVLIVQASNS